MRQKNTTKLPCTTKSLSVHRCSRKLFYIFINIGTYPSTDIKKERVNYKVVTGEKTQVMFANEKRSYFLCQAHHLFVNQLTSGDPNESVYICLV